MSKQSNKKAALYCRVANKDIDGHSIKNQVYQLIDYAVQNNYEYTGIYIDNGYSGLNCDRPAFTKLLSDIDTVDAVIIKDRSRLARDMFLNEFYVDWFAQKGVLLLSTADDLNDGFDLSIILQAYYQSRRDGESK